MLKDAKDNPQALGLLLIGAGTGIKTFFPQYDYVIFDFSGQHVAPPQATAAIQKAQATNTPVPSWISDIQAYLQILWDLAPIAPAGAIAESLPAATSAANALGVKTQNVFTLLGINLPTKLTLSEALIIGGLLGMFEPLLKTLAGSASSLLSTATNALKLG